MNRFILLGLSVVGFVACAVPTADFGGPGSDGEDATQKKIPLCGEGALGSDALQSGKKGGPDARAKVSCASGYDLCRVDPKGPDNDVCSDAKDCFACTRPGGGTVAIDKTLTCAAVKTFFAAEENNETGLTILAQSKLKGDALADFKSFQKGMLPDYPSEAYAVTIKRPKLASVPGIVVVEHNDGGMYGGVYLADGRRIGAGSAGESTDFTWDSKTANSCPTE